MNTVLEKLNYYNFTEFGFATKSKISPFTWLNEQLANNKQYSTRFGCSIELTESKMLWLQGQVFPDGLLLDY